MAIHITPSPEEILPRYHPVELIQASASEFWPTYFFLAVFIVVLVRRAVRKNSSDDQPICADNWLLPVFCCWGFQAVSFVLRGYVVSVQWVKLDMFIALTTLAVLTLVVVLAAALGIYKPSDFSPRYSNFGTVALIIATVFVDYALIFLLVSPVN